MTASWLWPGRAGHPKSATKQLAPNAGWPEAGWLPDIPSAWLHRGFGQTGLDIPNPQQSSWRRTRAGPRLAGCRTSLPHGCIVALARPGWTSQIRNKAAGAERGLARGWLAAALPFRMAASWLWPDRAGHPKSATKQLAPNAGWPEAGWLPDIP